MFASLRNWLQAARPLAQINIALPLLLGHAAGRAVQSDLSWHWVGWSLAWGVALHLCIVFSNDIADAASDSPQRTLLSGGSGVVVEGKLTVGQLRAGVHIALALIALTTAVLMFQGRWAASVATAVSLTLLWLYQGAPKRSYRGGGEWLQGLGVGGVLPALGFYLQTDSLAPYWLVVPTVLAGTASNVITAIPDVPADTRANKRTIPVRWGLRRAALFASIGIVVAAAIAAVATPKLPPALRTAIVMVGSLAPACLALVRAPLAYAIAQSSVHVAWLLTWCIILATS